MLLKHRKRYSPTSRKARVFKAPSRCFYKIRCQRIFFPTSRLTQERGKSSTDERPTRRVKDSPSSYFVLWVAQFKIATDFLYDELHTRAMEVRESQGGGWVCQGWSIATRREREQVKKRKEKDQGRQEGGSSEGNVPCVLNQEFLFLVHKYWGSEATRLGWSIVSYETWSTRKPCAKAVPETDSVTQQKQYHKRTTLRTMKLLLRSIHSKEGPHYCLSEAWESCHQTSNKCHMAWVCWRSHCKVFVARKARTIAFEQSARKLSEDKRQSTLFTRLDILWWFHTRAVLRSLANARKCQLEDFCEKERYESCSVQWTFTADTFRKKAEKGKFTGSDATARFPRASCFEKPTCSVPETWGRMYHVLALRN